MEDTMQRNNKILASVGIATIATLSPLAGADPVEGFYRDRPGCDDHGPLVATEEFGDPSVFGRSQRFEHFSTFTQRSACPAEDDPNIPNVLVGVTNITNRFLTDLFYVGDVGGGANTFFSNVDGLAGQTPPAIPLGGFAFRIDSVGMNQNLIFESMTGDGVLEPGEQWHFIVQDYRNDLGLPADALFSVGFAGSSPIGGSSASIVQFVPTPGATALLGLGGLCALRRRRGN
jgi:MYXO-CTERM domain-containing protein